MEREIIVPCTTFDFELDTRISQWSYIELGDVFKRFMFLFSDFPSSRYSFVSDIEGNNSPRYRRNEANGTMNLVNENNGHHHQLLMLLVLSLLVPFPSSTTTLLAASRHDDLTLIFSGVGSKTFSPSAVLHVVATACHTLTTEECSNLERFTSD